MESFWSFTKRLMAKFNGLTDEKFFLHLKKSKWRFNHRYNDIYNMTLKDFRKNPS